MRPGAKREESGLGAGRPKRGILGSGREHADSNKETLSFERRGKERVDRARKKRNISGSSLNPVAYQTKYDNRHKYAKYGYEKSCYSSLFYDLYFSESEQNQIKIP
jgi:hypothetical protein